MKQLNTPRNALAKRLLANYLRKHTRSIVIATICMLIAASATALNAYMLQPVMDDIFMKKNQTLLYVIPLVLFVVSIVNGFAGYIQQVIMKSIGQRVASDMQLDLYEHMLQADIAMFSDNASGKLLTRFTNDIQIIRRNFSTLLVGTVRESVTFVFLAGVMMYQSWELSLIAFFVLPIAIFRVYRMGRGMRKVSHSTQEELAEYSGQLDDTFQGIRMVKAYGMEMHEAERARTTVERLHALYIKAIKIESASSPMMETIAGLAVASVAFYGGYQVLNGTTTAGAFFSFIGALIMAYKPLKTLSNLNTVFEDAAAALRRFYDVMDQQALIQDKPDAKTLTLHTASIALDNVYSHYANTETSALNGVSISVPAGKRVALVGSSGSGKSTIIHLVQRFYDVAEGSIKVGGEDVRDITIASLRKHMAIVNQEATLFDDTIRNNIAYGKINATDAEVIAAAEAAAAHDFIIKQPLGYDTPIGQHGIKLSGGQRQRIAIARAMLRNAPILLLDEATSALDTVSEEQVQQALNTLMHGRTTLVIAHRLSTIQNADIIYVMNHGQVVESGTHTELMAKQGAYAQLQQQQEFHHHG